MKTSKMTDICTCCNGCSSTSQLSSYPKYSFPKKLLVAISIVVIIGMCIMPAEARTLEHKRRHRRPDNMAQPTKESLRITQSREHKKRHQKRLENLIQSTKDTMRRPKNPQADLFSNETRKIVKKLKNTKRFFMDDKKQLLKEVREYRDSMPNWLPTVNFVEIHYHDYRNNRSRQNGTTIPERKFTYLMPKLYKSLVEYEEIFKRLLHVELDFPDDPYNTYKKKRKQIIQNTLHKIYSTIQEVNDSMAAVKLIVPPTNKNKLNLASLDKKVDATQCLKNDYLAFRGYGNLLNNWYLEFRCKSGKQANKQVCRRHEAKLRERINSRLKDNKINPTLMNRLLTRT